MKVLAYARVSTQDQAKEGYSVPAQIRAIRESAKRNNLQIVREFTEAESAKAVGRKSFHKMVKFIKANPGNVDGIIAHKVDRLSRNFKDLLTLKELNMKLIFVLEEFPDNAMGRFILDMRVAQSAFYSGNLSEDVIKGMTEKAKQGLFPSRAALGYINVTRNGKRIIEPDPEIAPLIKTAFKLYSTGRYSLNQIRKLCGEQGLVYRQSRKPISKSTLDSMLKRPLYYGGFYWSGNLYRGTHDPIISKTLFDKVQQVRKDRSKPKRKSWRFAFSGLLVCGYCGCAITAEMKKGKYTYYHCTGYKGKCDQKWLREEVLSEILGEMLLEIRFGQSKIDWIEDVLISKHSIDLQQQETSMRALKSQANRVQNRLEKIYIDKLDGVVSEETWVSKSKEWEKEEQEILTRIKAMENIGPNFIDKGIQILELANNAYNSYLNQNIHERRRLLDCVLSNCEMLGEKLVPNYKKPFDILAKSRSCTDWLGERDSNPH